MNILIVDNQTAHLEQLVALLPETPTIIPWNTLSATDALGRDLIILSGGTDIPPVVKYSASYPIQKSIILGSDVPIIGICLGAQIIADTFDATLDHLPHKRHGIITIAPTERGTELLGIRSPFDVYEGHSWAIKTLPDSFDILATSSDGAELFKYRTRPIWGIQFHPEHLPDHTSGDEIFRAILSCI